ncbi:MAG: ComEC/Rec2 family competence protein [Lachnospiraceae bacterium]|nr:ComEC/Rec2 family competence protein [Lachnospiraceae bacterium]
MLYRLWFRPPALRTFLEESCREDVYLTAEGRILSVTPGTDKTAVLVRTETRELGTIRAYLPAGAEEQLVVGASVLLEGRLYLAPRATNPGEFDARAYYDRLGIRLMMEAESFRIEKLPYLPFADAANRLRLFFRKSIREALETDDAAFACSFLLGIRDEDFDVLTEEMEGFFLIRIMMQSGFHLVLLVTFLQRILQRIGVKAGTRAGILSFFSLFYAAFGGFSLSFMRTLPVVFLRLFAPVFRRKFDLVSAASLSLILLLLTEPGTLFTTSVQYAIAAYAAAGIFLPLARAYFRKISRVTAVIAGPLLMQLFFLPLQLASGGRTSVYAPLLHFVTAPLIPLVLVTGFFGAAFYGTGTLAGAGFFGTIFHAAGLGFFGTLHYALVFYRTLYAFLVKLPGAVLVNGSPGKGKIIIYYCLLFLPAGVTAVLLHFRKKVPEEKEKIPGKSVQFLLIPCVLLFYTAGLLFLRAPAPAEGEIRVVMIDVGQGDCFLVSTKDTNLLIDCGSSSREDVGTKVVRPVLDYYGVGGIDALILTHGDLDHTNGAAELFEKGKLDAEELILPEISGAAEEFESVLSVLKEETEVRRLSAGEAYAAGRMTLYCLWPEAGSDLRGNDVSLVLLLEMNGFRMLFTGDISAEVEAQLKLPEGGTDVLKAAHHGSDYSSSAKFLAALDPETVLVSYGRNNLYGHPGKNTIARFKAQGMEVYGTGVCGAVTLAVRKNRTTEISCFLD